MSDNELVETLKERSRNNPALNDVLHLFSLRKRARFIVTLAALKDRMTEEGFKHSEADYAAVLELLSKCNIGTLDRDSKGRVRSLKNIKISIPALGKAVLAGERVKGYRQRTQYKTVAQPVAPAVPRPEPEAPAPRAERRPRPYQVPGSKVVATVIGNSGQVVANVTFSSDATKEDIAEFFRRQLEGAYVQGRDA